MKKMIAKLAFLLAACLCLTGVPAMAQADVIEIALSDDGVTINGAAATDDKNAAVYVANDIVFYLAGQDFTYGEGTEADGHEQAEADAHTVVHITEPGTYELSGKLSAGQVAVDLGEEAEEDPEAVVTLILNGVDITCKVAPGVIFYSVYEPCEADEEIAAKDVDTSAAGANVIIADGSENFVNGSYVARIYEPGSVELSEDGTEVADAKKLHKYDGAFYSKMTMNITGGEKGDGVLNITAENEGLNSELHLTMNGGIVNIASGNDGINTNEDNISVCTVNGGELNIVVTGETGEGDGIDSNGWLVINGGRVTASGCGFSGDAGIDSDKGIYINGGSVAAGGNMLDHIAGGEQNHIVFSFASRQKGGSAYALKDADGNVVLECAPVNDFSYLVVADDAIVPGTYTFWCGDEQLAGGKSEGGMRGMTPPEGFEKPENGEMPEGMTPPEGFEMPDNGEVPEMPEGMTPPEGFKMPQNGERPEMPEGMQRPEGGMPRGRRGGFGGQQNAEISAEFVVVDGGNTFAFVGPAADE